MDRVFVDTDVVIDFLIDREPFSEDAAKLFTYSERGVLKVCLSSLCFNNLYYVIRKLEGRERAILLLERIEKIVTILPVDDKIIRQALVSDIKDFEDAVQHYCAKAAGITTILTRNIKDYSKSELAIHSPESYLQLLRRK